MQVEQRGILPALRDGAEGGPAGGAAHFLIVQPDDPVYGRVAVEQGGELPARDHREHRAVLLMPAQEDARGQRHVAQGAEAHGDHVRVAYA